MNTEQKHFDEIRLDTNQYQQVTTENLKLWSAISAITLIDT